MIAAHDSADERMVGRLPEAPPRCPLRATIHSGSLRDRPRPGRGEMKDSATVTG
jgi:hypothetical protein